MDYIYRLADKYKGHASTVGAASGPHVFVGSTCKIRAPAPRPSIFVGGMSPTNVTTYIHWCHITDEYLELHSSELRLLVYLLVN
jgi:hypothetical protein